MKIGILTYHDTTNYGAVLQAYALQTKINELGNECEIIDYKCDAIVERYKITPFYKCINLKKIIKSLLTNKNNKELKKKFDEFNNKYQKISLDQYNVSNIATTNNIYDKFIVGSDQVWNLDLCGKDTTYMLDFVENDKKKYSYAASFGYETVPNEYRNITKIFLEKFEKILVREEQGQRIIKQLLGKDVEKTIDPTLLLSSNEWNQIINNENKKKDDNYILLYIIAPNKEIINFAKKVAKKEKCKLIYLNNSYKKVLGAKNIKAASPQEFINYIKNAKYVITTSFHGVAFSINYEKQFFYALSSEKKNYNSRIENLVKMFELENRIIGRNLNNYNKIEYSNIMKKLDKVRYESIEILKKELESNYDKK